MMLIKNLQVMHPDFTKISFVHFQEIQYKIIHRKVRLNLNKIANILIFRVYILYICLKLYMFCVKLIKTNMFI